MEAHAGMVQGSRRELIEAAERLRRERSARYRRARSAVRAEPGPLAILSDRLETGVSTR
jgi:hypothetical protein